jgi:phage FluMu protein Com
MLHEVRCKCGRLLGKINGEYEIKCVRCKALKSGTIPLDKQYDPVKGE